MHFDVPSFWLLKWVIGPLAIIKKLVPFSGSWSVSPKLTPGVRMGVKWGSKLRNTWKSWPKAENLSSNVFLYQKFDYDFEFFQYLNFQPFWVIPGVKKGPKRGQIGQKLPVCLKMITDGPYFAHTNVISSKKSDEGIHFGINLSFCLFLCILGVNKGSYRGQMGQK